MRTPDRVLSRSRAPDLRLPPGKRTGSQYSRKGTRLRQLPLRTSPSPLISECSPPRVHTRTLCPRKAAPARRPEAGAGAVPPHSRRVYTNLFARGRRGDPARSARGCPAWGTRETGLTRDRGRLGRPLRRPHSCLPGAASPQPRSAQSRAPLAPARPWAVRDERPDAAVHSAPLRGSSGLRTSGLSRGSRAGGRRAGGGPAGGGLAGTRLCTCSLARPGDSGWPPPGPRGACAAALPLARGRGRGSPRGRPPPAPAHGRSPLRGPVPSEDQDTQSHTRTHTASLAVLHTPGECIGVSTQTHVDTNTLGTTTQGRRSPHSLRHKQGRRTLPDTNTPNRCFTDSHTPGSVPHTQKHPGTLWWAHTHTATPLAAFPYQHTVRHTWTSAPPQARPRHPCPDTHAPSETVPHGVTTPQRDTRHSLPAHSVLCRQRLHCSAPTLSHRPMP